MGLVDKVKAQAGQALNAAQAGVDKGSAKLEERRDDKTHQELLRKLGAAVWAERRQGGSKTGVDRALTALDKFEAEQQRKSQA